MKKFTIKISIFAVLLYITASCTTSGHHHNCPAYASSHKIKPTKGLNR